MKNIRALTDRILFRFLEVTSKNQRGTFENITNWGFDIGNSFDETAKHPRWGVVVAIGPDVKEKGIIPGANIFIEELKWTNSVDIEGIGVIWQTDESHILGIEAI